MQLKAAMLPGRAGFTRLYGIDNVPKSNSGLGFH
jgi:hypothetical protein